MLQTIKKILMADIKFTVSASRMEAQAWCLA